MDNARKQIPRLSAVLLIVLAAFMTLGASANVGSVASLRARFSFTKEPLVSVADGPTQSVRQLEPAYQKISTWLSSVGAGVALTDLRGNGLPQDACLVDPHTDTVTVEPAPGTPVSYKPFALEPGPQLYNRNTMAPMGCLPGDFNEDGWMDLLVIYWGRTPIIFLRRPNVHTLSNAAFKPQAAIPGNQSWSSDTVLAADLDGSGHPDLIVGDYPPDGNRLLDRHATSDPAMQMQSSFSNAQNGGGTHILMWTGARGGNDPAVSYRDESAAIPNAIRHGWTLGLAAQNLDQSLLPSIYVANDFGPDRLLYNESTPGHLKFVNLHGQAGFTIPKSYVLGNDSFKGMGVDFGDINGDGKPDIFVSNLTNAFGLEETNFAWINTGDTAEMKKGIAPFTDEADSLGLGRDGWSWDAKFGDFDNSGTQDIVVAIGFVKGTHNLWPQLQELAMANDSLEPDVGFWPQLTTGTDVSGKQSVAFFVKGTNGKWVNVATQIGVGDNSVGRGISTGDVYGNGHLDFAVASQWGQSYLYKNTCVKCGRLLDLNLLLPPMGRTLGKTTFIHGAPGAQGSPAYGATATLTLPGGHVQQQQVDGGNGEDSFRSTHLYFGLGSLPADYPLRVHLTWRDRNGFPHSEFIQVTAGRYNVLLASGSER